jgi:hypothetical protein
MTISVKRFQRTWHLGEDIYLNKDDTVKPEFLDLYMTFLRNRVILQLTRDDEESPDEEVHLHDRLERHIVNSLEANCTGFWAVKVEDHPRDENFSLYLMFEKEEDLKHFLKNDGLMLKLAI